MHDERNREIIGAFAAWARAKHSPETVKSYMGGLRSLFAWAHGAGKGFAGLTPDDFVEWINSLEARGLKSGTRSIYVTSAKSMWRWMRSRGEVSWDEKAIPTPPVRDSESYPTMTPEDYAALSAAYSDRVPTEIRDAAILAMLWATGVRVSELLSVDVADLDMERRSAVVRTFKRRNHRRVVFWTAEADARLRQWLQVRSMMLGRDGIQSEPAFVSLSTRSLGDRLDRSGVEKSFRRARERAGIRKRLSPHSCRHGNATEMLKRGTDIRLIQEFLGHARLNTTSRYAHVERPDLAEAYRKAFPNGGISANVKPYEAKDEEERGAPEGPHDPRPVLRGARPDVQDKHHNGVQDSAPLGLWTTGLTHC